MSGPHARLRVRWRDGGFEAQCGLCEEFLPLTAEFWSPKNGVTRCRACWTEYHRLRQQGYREDEATREVGRFKNRLHHAVNRERYNAICREWKAVNKPRIAAYNAAYRALRKGDPKLMERYRLDWPDLRPKRTDPAADRRLKWRETKRRQRAA